MGLSVGRVRQCAVLDIKFVVLANNVSIGAATSSIISAEFAVLRVSCPFEWNGMCIVERK